MAGIAALSEGIAALKARLESAECAIFTPEEDAHLQACLAEVAAVNDNFARAIAALAEPMVATRAAQGHLDATLSSMEASLLSDKLRIEQKQPRYLELLVRREARSVS